MVYHFLATYYVLLVYYDSFFFFFKQKTAYEMRISDWSSDVCSSDLRGRKKAPAGEVRGFFPPSPISPPPPLSRQKTRRGTFPCGSSARTALPGGLRLGDVARDERPPGAVDRPEDSGLAGVPIDPLAGGRDCQRIDMDDRRAAIGQSEDID